MCAKAWMHEMHCVSEGEMPTRTLGLIRGKTVPAGEDMAASEARIPVEGFPGGRNAATAGNLNLFCGLESIFLTFPNFPAFPTVPQFPTLSALPTFPKFPTDTPNFPNYLNPPRKHHVPDEILTSEGE